MDKDAFHFSNQSSDNNDDLLLEIANDLNKIINYINDNVLIIKKNNYNEINLRGKAKMKNVSWVLIIMIKKK